MTLVAAVVFHDAVGELLLALFDVDLLGGLAVEDHLVTVLLENSDGLLIGLGDLRHAQLNTGKTFDDDLIALLEIQHFVTLLKKILLWKRLTAPAYIMKYILSS